LDGPSRTIIVDPAAPYELVKRQHAIASELDIPIVPVDELETEALTLGQPVPPKMRPASGGYISRPLVPPPGVFVMPPGVFSTSSGAGSWQFAATAPTPVVQIALRVGRGEQPAAIATALDVDLAAVYASFKLIVGALPSPRHQFVTVSELRAALEAQLVAATV
jgi:hypothetical protein